MADLADQTLFAMIRAKRGVVPPDNVLPWTKEPLVTVSREQLRPLQGTYLVGVQVTAFRAEGDHLHLLRGTRNEPLGAFSDALWPRQ